MMNVKPVVKVMNFHSLLRVDSSSKLAVKYNKMEEELSEMIQIILNNKNFKLDKVVHTPKDTLPKLKIYFGSDLGFCGNVNTSITSLISQDAKDENTELVIIGKKLSSPKNRKVLLRLARQDYEKYFESVRKVIERGVKQHLYSSIELVYNHYYNTSTIKTERKQIYPLQLTNKDATKYQWDDFEIDSNPVKLLEDMIVSCLMFEVLLAASSAYASENIMRQNATSESIKKLDEIEVEEVKANRKERNRKQFKKTIDSYVKQKALKRL